jgi:hypothetical protein
LITRIAWKNLAKVEICSKLSTFAIVNIFSQPLSTTLSTINHPLLYNHYIYASLSHVNRFKTEDKNEKKKVLSVQEASVQRKKRKCNCESEKVQI